MATTTAPPATESIEGTAPVSSIVPTTQIYPVTAVPSSMQTTRLNFGSSSSSFVSGGVVTGIPILSSGISPLYSQAGPSFTRSESPFDNLRTTLPAPPHFGSSSPNPTSPLFQAPFSNHLNQTCTVKLDRSNYLLWRYTVLPIIKGYKLEHHLFNPSPISNDALQRSVAYNPVPHLMNDEWHTKDNLLMGWLLGSMTEQALSEVVGCSTAYEIWTTLESLFNSRSESRMLEYKDALSRASKGSKSMSDYLAQMKSYSDNLTAAGYPITKSELILATLGGLDRDYESAVVNITSRVGSLSWQDVQSQLITHERLIARYSGTNPTANLVQGQHIRPNSNSGGRTQYQQGSGGRGRSRGSRGRGRNGNGRGSGGYSGSKMVCQLCGKTGHIVTSCWHRFEEDFVPPSNLSGGDQKQASAYVASPQSVGDAAWYMDSGATNHLTADLNNLHLSSGYNGSENLAVGNGQNNRDTSLARCSQGWPVSDQSSK